MEITEMHKKMRAARGCEVELHLVGGFKTIVGKCVGYTQPLDNDPEIASIDIKVPGISCIYEITENEIETLIIKK